MHSRSHPAGHRDTPKAASNPSVVLLIDKKMFEARSQFVHVTSPSQTALKYYVDAGSSTNAVLLKDLLPSVAKPHQKGMTRVFSPSPSHVLSGETGGSRDIHMLSTISATD